VGREQHAAQALLAEKKKMNMIGALDYEAAAAMTEAFNKACEALHDWGQPDVITNIVAKRIIEVAELGERNPDQLCERALKSLGFSESPGMAPRPWPWRLA
jgi:hypothetical protein